VVVGSSAWFASVAWGDWIMGFVFRKLRSVAYRYRIPATTSFWGVGFILPGSVFRGIGKLSGGASRQIRSMWRTLKMSHECRWRDLLRARPA